MADLQVLKALLPDNPLCGISTYKDTLNLATGACTRQIKKLVLTGKEIWSMEGGATPYPYIARTNMPYPHEFNSPLICSHFPNTGLGMVNATSYAFLTGGYAQTGATDLASWKQYLADQYTAGTPVTVWYVLATAETSSITVPTGLSGTVEGYLNQSGTPTPTNPIYPTANNVEVWVHSLRKLTTATEAVENPLYSDGTPITSYTIKGNTVQNGTPTPSNPVDVNGVGVRTGNLFDGIIGVDNVILSELGNLAQNNAYAISKYIPVKPNTSYIYHFYHNIAENRSTYSISEYDSNKNVLLPLTLQWITENRDYNISFTTRANTAYIRINWKKAFDEDLMLNTGSTALPYEPYGYKIPILSGQQITNIYIGDLPLLKSLDGTAVDEISNGTLTRRVDSDGSVLPTPTIEQITMPSIPTIEGANSIIVDTTVQPSEFTATWTGWHDASVKEWDGSAWS